MTKIELLKNHHHKLRFLMEEMIDPYCDVTKGLRLVEELKNDLHIHKEIRRSCFYPMSEATIQKVDLPYRDAQKEVQLLLERLEQLKANSPMWKVIALSLKERIVSILEEEEDKLYHMVMTDPTPFFKIGQNRAI